MRTSRWPPRPWARVGSTDGASAGRQLADRGDGPLGPGCIDLVGPAFIDLATDGTGAFRFIAVEGYLDSRRAETDGHPRLEFTWEGNDEGDRARDRRGRFVEASTMMSAHLTKARTSARTLAELRRTNEAGHLPDGALLA